jgi:hypothetical protein
VLHHPVMKNDNHPITLTELRVKCYSAPRFWEQYVIFHPQSFTLRAIYGYKRGFTFQHTCPLMAKVSAVGKLHFLTFAILYYIFPTFDRFNCLIFGPELKPMKTATTYLLLLCIAIVPALTLQAQFTVIPDTNAAQLAQLLAGPGVTITNTVLHCNQSVAVGSGRFTNGGPTVLGIGNGIILSTGIADLIDTAALEFASDLGVTTNDTDLQKLSPSFNPTFDCCILEFDLVPQAGRLRLNYIFASEEYPEYVCSNFGDVMAFYVSGPNPTGGMYNKLNIANVPGTNLTVCVNTINPGVPGNSSGGGTCNLPGQSMAYPYLYQDNYLGTDIVYDGLTTLLTAGINVVPGQVYHLKLAVADIFDQAFDSGIFLEAGSLNSSDYTVETQGVSLGSNTAAAEGCYDGSFRFLLNWVTGTPTTISFSIGGTAVNGVDYAAIDTFLTIAAADTVGIVNINPVNDGFAEGNETVVLYLRDLVNQQVFDSVTLYITDGIFAHAHTDKDTVCAGQPITLTAGGGVTYVWGPGQYVADSTAQTTTAAPVTTSTYILAATAGACTAYDTLIIQVDANTFTVSAGANTGICKYDTLQLQSTVVPDTGAYTMQWFTTAGTFISASANAVVSPTSTTSYVFEAAKGYCSAADTVTVTVSYRFSCSYYGFSRSGSGLCRAAGAA